ncbi:uncharacterized protein ZHAS_00010385 [Anopheles sinensis]|uniref:Uncharacterized protein n=1 Tax=Anopheles sinensis TaxID=74873 RepID=A0A084VXG0_ANOSI|nr:uncharacterized protein ZHAS_00010385 [Anopheles sinensis]
MEAPGCPWLTFRIVPSPSNVVYVSIGKHIVNYVSTEEALLSRGRSETERYEVMNLPAWRAPKEHKGRSVKWSGEPVFTMQDTDTCNMFFPVTLPGHSVGFLGKRCSVHDDSGKCSQLELC